MRLAERLQDPDRRWRFEAPTRPPLRRTALVAGVAASTLLLSTALVALLERGSIGIADASPVYLIAVVAVGAVAGLWPAVATSIVAFVLYDVLFTEPRFSLVVADAREWLDLLLFLFVALVIGRLVALQHARADEAARRAGEASSLYALSRSLALAGSTAEAAPDVAARLAADVGLDRVVILAGRAGAERVIADTDRGANLPTPAVIANLVRTPGDEPARWVRTHAAGGSSVPGADHYRVRIEIDGVALGAIVAVGRRAQGPPGREATRILALAADQLATSLRRDDLRRVAMDLEIARQGDALKTALIASVSHDLRTPLAGIRATAGGLADPDVAWTDDERRAAAAVIDAEATRLDGIVRGLLDLGRIASGAIHPDLEPHEPWSIIRPAVDRLRPALGDRPVRVDVPDDLPPVLVDAALLDNIVTNLVDNAARHAPPPAAVAVTASARPPAPSGEQGSHPAAGRILLTVEDGGPGVPQASLGRLFERFERADRGRADAREGLGIGLSVVKGLVEAMGGSVAAAQSPLGGLAVTVTLRAAETPEERT